MSKVERPIHRKKKTGRPSKGVERLAEDFGYDQMERQLRHQMKALERVETANSTAYVPYPETDSFRIVMAELARQGGPLLKSQALWLIGREEKNADIPPDMRPNSRNQAAVEKWLRNPLLSSYWAAMKPRPAAKKKPSKKLAAYVGKPR